MTFNFDIVLDGAFVIPSGDNGQFDYWLGGVSAFNIGLTEAIDGERNTQTILGLARIVSQIRQIVTAKAHITVVTQRTSTQLGVARVQTTGDYQQTGLGRIQAVAPHVILGQSRIQRVIVQSITAKANITAYTFSSPRRRAFIF